MECKLETVLRVEWIVVILPILIASLPSSHLNPFHHFVLGFVGRGKTFQSSSRFSKLSLPQKFYFHFYVVGVIWTSLLLLISWIYAHNVTSKEHSFKVWRSVFLLILMEFQVLRRFYESLYVFNYSSTARMSIIGYIRGLYFYIVTPLSLACNCASEAFSFVANEFSEFIVKRKSGVSLLEFKWFEYLSPLLHLGWIQWIGALIFFYGWLHQRRCHAILGNLREGKNQAHDYRIPYGDWFEIVSSPHYLAEIVIFGGLLVASGGQDRTLWIFYTIVVGNLVFSAAETHRWYRQKFDNYPSNRYAIFPFVY